MPFLFEGGKEVMKMPDKIVNYKVYKDGKDLLGTADVQLPDIEALSETIKGAGIAGEVELPVIGHFSAMNLTINWRTITGNLIELAEQRAHSLDFRVAQQGYDTGKGILTTNAVKHVVKAIPKKLTIGKLEAGATADAGNEFSVTYYKMMIDGKVMIEIDPFNYICIINGVDYLKDVRNNLGM